MGETSLLIFTLCLQGAAGTMLFITLASHFYKDKQFKNAATITAVLSVIGVFASFIHLGQPLNALNVLGNLGSSWLSNEAVLAGFFMGIAVLYTLFLYLKPENKSISNVLGWIGSLLGLATVFAMAKVYTNTIVPYWQGANTFIDFFATTVALGALIFYASGLTELNNTNKSIFAYTVLGAVIIQVAAAAPHGVALGLQGAAAQASAEILTGMNLVVGLKWLLILGGAGLLIWAGNCSGESSGAKNTAGTVYLAGTALIVGQALGRYLFYAAIVAMNIGLT